MTSRQFYIMFWIMIVSLKIQKMPGLMYEFMGKDFYLMLVPYIIINAVGILMAFYILKKTQSRTLTETSSLKWVAVLQRLLAEAHADM